MDNKLLEVKNLNIAFENYGSKIKILKDISFTLGKGETLGIVGESGSGKSVMALGIMGLLSKNAVIESGSIEFEGTDLLKLSERKMRTFRGSKISMVFQEPMTSLNPLLTIGNQLEECIRTHQKLSRSERKKVVLEVLELVEIPNPKERLIQYPHELSGGQIQRVLIGMAIASKPRLIICDEPTTALDRTTQSEILRILEKLKNNFSTSILFISHDLEVIENISDNIMVMYGGEILEYGRCSQIVSSPSHPYTEALIQAIPRRSKGLSRLNVIKGNIPDFRNKPRGCIFNPRCKYVVEECMNKEPKFNINNDIKVKCFKYENV